jgi:putative transposase
MKLFSKTQRHAIRFDNGADLTSYAFTEWVEQNEIEYRFIQRGKPNQNALTERFNKSFRKEILDANLFNTLSEDQELAD